MTLQFHFWRLLWLMPLFFCLQTTWLSNVQVGGVPLDLTFGVALCAATLGGIRIGFLVGAGAGFLAAIAAMWHPGSFLLSRVLPCLLVGLLAPRFRASHPLAPPLVALFGATLSDITFLLLSPTEFSNEFWKIHVLSAGITQAFMAWPLFWLTQRIVAPPQKLIWR